MYIAMNRFRIVRGHEETFVTYWKNRESYLDEVPGFTQFHLLQGPQTEQETLFISHTVWASKEDFLNWTQSEAFRKAHAKANLSPRDIYVGPPKLELFDAIL